MGADTFRYGESDTRLRSVVHSIGLVVAAYALGITLVIVVFNALSLVGVSFASEADIPASIRALSTVLQFTGFFIVGLWYLRRRSDPVPLFKIRIPSLREAGWIVLGFFGLFLLLAVLGNIISALGVDVAENAAITQGQSQPSYLLYLIPIAFLFNAPAEELIFRGIVQGLFRRAYGVVPGVVIASLLFGVVHYVALGGTGSKLVYVLVAIALGLILGALYEKTENLAVPILVHAAYNAVQFYISYLVATGGISA
jgi:membrane protease YdiL (CAAX protease family)